MGALVNLNQRLGRLELLHYPSGDLLFYSHSLPVSSNCDVVLLATLD
jgi:hypothetical protein